MLWLETDYFHDFRCKCGDCRKNCCDAWDIAVSKTEYMRMTTMECSDELYRRIESALRTPENPTDARFRLFSRNFFGHCPMVDPDGLCAMQKEKGEAVLTEVCRVFPRSMKSANGRLRAVCTMGCEAVIELLDAKDALEFVTVEDDLHANIVDAGNIELSERAFAILRDRTRSMKARMTDVLRLTDPDAAPAEDDIAACFEVIDALRDYSPTLDELAARLEPMRTDGSARLAAYDAAHPDHELREEMYMLNHALYEDWPAPDPRITEKDAAEGLRMTYLLTRLVRAAADGDPTDDLTDLFRVIEHTGFYYNCAVLARRRQTA